MKYEIFSYRYGLEILQHPNFVEAWNEIEGIVKDAPLFIYPNKSAKNSKLYVVQQAMNAYFDRMFVINHGWQHHPLATGIAQSQLKADYRKRFVGANGEGLGIQTEVQFGNMARWYTDIFKFQTAYSQKQIQLGLSIVPQDDLSVVIDSNIVKFDRTKRELPSAELSITLPIIMMGVIQDESTPVVDLSRAQFSGIKQITGKGNSANLRRIVHAYVEGRDIASVSSSSDPGPEIQSVVEAEEEEQE